MDDGRKKCSSDLTDGLYWKQDESLLEEEKNADPDKWRPRAIDFEEMRMGLNDVEARTRKQLHDNTHVYSPTEQFLYKTMVSNFGRMTRSRTKVMMKGSTPSAECENKGASSAPNYEEQENSHSGKATNGRRSARRRRLDFSDASSNPDSSRSELLLKNQRACESVANEEVEERSDAKQTYANAVVEQIVSEHRSPIRGVSGYSSVAELVERTITKQQEIENSRSSLRSKPHPPSSGSSKRRARSAGVVAEVIPAVSACFTNAEQVDQTANERAKLTRRRMVDDLPGPISYPNLVHAVYEPRSRSCPLLRWRCDAYDEVVAKFAPTSVDFDPNELISAIKSGDFIRFRRATVNFCALRSYADQICSLISDWRDENCGTLVHLVCRSIKCGGTHEGDDLVHALVKYSPDLLRVRDTLKQIPLHIAVERGEVCRVAKLLQLGSPICWVDNHSLSPLRKAYIYGNVNMLKLLLNSGATFHELLANEERLPPPRRGHLFKTLLKHTAFMNGILRDARKKILRNIIEVAPLSPIFITPLRDALSPVFRFFHTPTPGKLEDGVQVPMLFTYLGVNRPIIGRRAVEWVFRCHGPLQCFAPTLNGRLLEPMTGRVPLGVPTRKLLTDTFVFFCPLKPGLNELTFKIHESHQSLQHMFAANIVSMRRTNPNLANSCQRGDF